MTSQLDPRPMAAAPLAPAAPAAPSGVPQRRRLGEWHDAVRWCTVVFLVVRTGLFALGVLSTRFASHGVVGVPGYEFQEPASRWHLVFTAWERWDALWYLKIIAGGYDTDTGTAAFFPAFPLLSRVLSWFTGGPLVGAYLVSNVSLLVALVLLYRLTELEFSSALARPTVVFACVFPTSFFLFAPYTESLFLAFAVGSFYAARRRRWLWAGLLAAGASSTRSTGLLLALPLAVEALLQSRDAPGLWRDKVPTLARGLGAAALAGLGTVTYLLFWRSKGEWDRPLTLQQTYWQKTGSHPLKTMVDAFHQLSHPDPWYAFYSRADLAVVLVVIACGLWLSLRARPTYAVWFWVSLAFPMLYEGPNNRALQSLPRYSVVVFPLFWALARLGQRGRVTPVLVAVSTTWMVVLGLLFVNWYWIY